MPDPPAPASFRYFAYGSNLDGARLRLSCPSARPVTVARLPVHRLAFTRLSERWGGGVADILPHPTSEVWGLVWNIPLAEAPALDRQEGLHLDLPAYRHYEVTVDLTEPAHGPPVTCHSYRVVTPSTDHIPPSRAYLDTMLRGARHAALPAAYVAALEAVKTV